MLAAEAADWHAVGMSDGGAGTDGEVRSGTAEAGSDEYGRGISFFDAVYGFAITLLVANVDPPSPEEWRTLEGLAGSALGSQLLGLALSFAVIAVFWRVNVLMMRTLRGMDGATVGANLVAMGFILLIRSRRRASATRSRATCRC